MSVVKEDWIRKKGIGVQFESFSDGPVETPTMKTNFTRSAHDARTNNYVMVIVVNVLSKMVTRHYSGIRIYSTLHPTLLHISCFSSFLGQ